MAAELALDVLGEAGPLVVHGDHDAGQNQARVELGANQAERVEELDEPLEREVLGLDGNDHAVGGGEGVDRHRPQRRRAVEQRQLEALAHGPERVAQPALGALDPGQLDRGAGEVTAGGYQPEVVGPGGARRLGHGRAGR